MSRPKRYVEGVRKVAIPPKIFTPNDRDDFLGRCAELGHALAAWNGEIWFRDGSVWLQTPLLLTDFEC